MKEPAPEQPVDVTDNFLVLSQARFADIFYQEATGTILCVLKEEYVPIKHFKDTFAQITALIEGNPVYTKFIFDKRVLRAFHQPSMEWYFIEWKTQMLDHGLYQHRKLLPEAAWFRKSVEIARNQILNNFSDQVKAKLDIRYCESIEEAMAQ